MYMVQPLRDILDTMCSDDVMSELVNSYSSYSSETNVITPPPRFLLLLKELRSRLIALNLVELISSSVFTSGVNHVSCSR